MFVQDYIFLVTAKHCSSTKPVRVLAHWYSISHRWVNSKYHCHLIRYVIFLFTEITQESLRMHTTTPTLCFSEFSVLCLNIKKMVPLFLLYLNNASKKSLSVPVFSFPSHGHINKLLEEGWFVFLTVWYCWIYLILPVPTPYHSYPVTVTHTYLDIFLSILPDKWEVQSIIFKTKCPYIIWRIFSVGEQL